MRKILLISLAAVIVAGGLAITAYGAEREGREGRPRFERRPEGRPGDARRRGPPTSQLSVDQRGALENDKAVKEARAKLEVAVANFQEAVKNVLTVSIKDEAQLNRAARMFVFQTIMKQMRLPRYTKGGGEKGPSTRGLERGRRRGPGPGGPPPPE